MVRAVSPPEHPLVLDPARLAALRETGLLDSAPEEVFDRWTQLAARILGTPAALISLVDDRRQFFKIAVGLVEPWASRRETPLSHSFCKHVVASGETLVVNDAEHEPRVAGNLAITELGVISYAGAPLKDAQGHTLGALCAIDEKPHQWSEEDIVALQALASSVMSEIELRGAVRRAEKSEADAKESQQRAERSEAGAKESQQRAERSEAGAKESQRRAEQSADEARMAQLRAERSEADAKESQQRAEKSADEARMAQLRAEKSEADAKESQQRAEKSADEARTAQLRAERSEADAKESQLRAEQSADEARTAQQRAERSEADAKESQLRAEKSEEQTRAALQRAEQSEADAKESQQRAEKSADEARTAQLRAEKSEADAKESQLRAEKSEEQTRAALQRAEQSEAETRRQALLARSIVAQVDDAISAVDLSGRPLLTNPAAARLAAQLADEGAALSLDSKPLERGQWPLQRALRGETVPEQELLATGPQLARGRWFAIRARPLHDETGAPIGAIELARDVTEAHEAREALRSLNERLREESFADELTGLYNRRGFLTMSEQALRVAQRSLRQALVFYVDLDGMKEINDRFGHEAGDEALIESASVLRATFRDVDVLARMGGDEFAVLAVEASGDAAPRLEVRLQKIIEETNAERARRFQLSMSCGSAVFDPFNPEPLPKLLARADAAMYENKRDRRGRAAVR